ncbi:LysR family transcriptional regulator [Vibrio cholerae]|uniref:LysR family transcriptional regulator n=1 Tax=Vibrio cholerae TaxID=666 RepID=UPI00019F5884|nr:LysR family transcriptional regulator [Vibrio cholerae]EEO03237.1 LysR-family transcriptional regulator [Vibrio cholerae VL426]
MNLTHLQSFMAVAKLGSFSAAAEQLDTSKGQLSRHVKSLEQMMGCLLMHRTTRRLSLTEAGQALYEKACEIDSLAYEAERIIKDLTQDNCGTLKLTAPNELGNKLLYPMLEKFLAAYPEVKLELCFERSLQDIEFGSFDLGLRTTLLHSENLIARFLGRIRYGLVAAPMYLQAQSILHPNELQSHQLLSSGESEWLFTLQPDHLCKVAVNPIVKSSNYATTRLLVLNGLGIARLPFYLIEEEVRKRDLIAILPQWQISPYELYMVYAKQRLYPKKLRDLQEAIFQWFQSHPNYLI